jgi:hypothetical protein
MVEVPVRTVGSTSTVEQRHDADLVVPRTTGNNLEPSVLTTIPIGSGEGELVLQNGEFTIPIAVFPTSLLVLEDVPFSGFTGRVLQFDRNGRWQHDLGIDGIAGSTPLWVKGAPNGTLFVAAIIESAAGTHVRVSAHRLDGDTFRVLDTVDLPGLETTEFAITPDGLVADGNTIISIDTGVVAGETTVAVDTIDASSGRITVTRSDGAVGRRWVIDIELDDVHPPSNVSTQAGRFGSGVWYLGVTSDDPEAETTFLALLDPDGTNEWYRLGPWSLAAADENQLIFTKVTTDGLTIAAVGR